MNRLRSSIPLQSIWSGNTKVHSAVYKENIELPAESSFPAIDKVGQIGINGTNSVKKINWWQFPVGNFNVNVYFLNFN